MRRMLPLVSCLLLLALAGCGSVATEGGTATVPIGQVQADIDQRKPIAATPADVARATRAMEGQKVVLRGRYVRGGAEPAPAFVVSGGGDEVVVVLPEALEGQDTDFRSGDGILVRGVIERVGEKKDQARQYPIEGPDESGERVGELGVFASEVRTAGDKPPPGTN